MSINTNAAISHPMFYIFTIIWYWNSKKSAKIQAVRHDDLLITGIAFHEAGKLITDKLTLSVDETLLVLIDHEKGLVSVSDPTAKLQMIIITNEYPSDQFQQETVYLLSNKFAGKSVNFKMER